MHLLVSLYIQLIDWIETGGRRTLIYNERKLKNKLGKKSTIKKVSPSLSFPPFFLHTFTFVLQKESVLQIVISKSNLVFASYYFSLYVSKLLYIHSW